jgi:hypothetical protein
MAIVYLSRQQDGIKLRVTIVHTAVRQLCHLTSVRCHHLTPQSIPDIRDSARLALHGKLRAMQAVGSSKQWRD